jgi:hypothetical protein
MRLQVAGFVAVLVLVSQGAAQDIVGSSTAVLNGAPDRDHLRSSSGVESRGAVRIPSRLHDGVRRDVGAYFDSRMDVILSNREGNNRLSASANDNSQNQLGKRNPPKKRPPDYRSKPPFQYKSREEGTVEVNRRVLHADLQLAHRLAEIDRLRDHALANDDVDLLMRADILEQQARVHHQQHVQQMQFAAEQGDGEKNESNAENSLDADEPATTSASGTSRGRAYPNRRVQYEMDSTVDHQSDSLFDSEERDQGESDRESMDDDAIEQRRGGAQPQADVRDEASERRRIRSRMPIPRETRVTDDREFEVHYDADYEATVRAARSDN